ncbi:MAG: D-glycero-beta-D-manno-heptose 1,7-bisphosphate 7-phosphatase [Paracoccaceae bacterium]|nr:D-glycero-beta-D-manno-heptose 1,7-bisphosphate 7-phosphatase [Paracoccaceae bacterium]MDG2258373.1 D-glycero-beta-D-manno-heptose 1,7-bisphosphate 7-phosphatase [Paracoccaceae bacterium]
MSKNKAAFIDRDGVINVERDYVGSLEEFEFIDGAISGLRLLQNSGFLLIVITNQAGIARGFYSEKNFHDLTRSMNQMLAQNGVDITEVFFCPHHPVAGVGQYKQDCKCRKPKPGMIFEAASKHNIDLTQSVLVGDKITDIQAGLASGIENNLLVESGHDLSESGRVMAMATCADLFQAASLIVSESRYSSNI